MTTIEWILWFIVASPALVVAGIALWGLIIAVSIALSNIWGKNGK